MLFSQTNDLSLIKKSEQLILVTSGDWNSTKAEMQLFERNENNSKWISVTEKISAVLGRNGLGWGTDFADGFEGPEKKEGDGKSPAGIFTLSSAFGFESVEKSEWIELPYFKLTSDIECVDDINSANYNKIVNRSDKNRKDWNSSEKMREIEQYKLGIIVDYNADPVVPGCGSCIFIHIWSGPKSSTSGCTAISEENIRKLLLWLDPDKNPVLVQIPISFYEKFRNELNLP